MDIDEQMLADCVSRAEQLILADFPPEQTMQHHFSRHFRRKMRALCRYERRTPRMRRAVHQAKAVAAACAVVVVMLMGAVMNVDAARSNIFKFFTQRFENMTSVKVSGNGGLGYFKFEAKTPTYIPDGYEKIDERSDERTHVIVYENESGESLIFSQDQLTAGTHIFDTENSDIEEIYLKGQYVTLSKKKDSKRCMIYWYDQNYSFWISGSGITDMEIKKMAESVINKNSKN